MSPRGFYTAREAVDYTAREADTLRREQAGAFPRGLYAALAAVEHMPEERQRPALELIVEQTPSCAPGWSRYSNFVRDGSERLSVIERRLAARPDPDTWGSLTVKKAMMLSKFGQTDRALEILEPLAASVGDSLSTNAAAYLALAKIRPAREDKTSERSR